MFGYTNAINQSLFMHFGIALRNFEHGPSLFPDSSGEESVLGSNEVRKVFQKSHGFLKKVVQLFDGLVTEEDMVFRLTSDPIQNSFNTVSHAIQSGSDREIRLHPLLLLLTRRTPGNDETGQLGRTLMNLIFELFRFLERFLGGPPKPLRSQSQHPHQALTNQGHLPLYFFIHLPSPVLNRKSTKSYLNCTMIFN